MALIIADRVKETTVTQGTGTISLSGATFGGFQSFSDAIGEGNTTYYCIQNESNFEIGIGTYGSNNLERTTVLSSSNSGDKISLGGSGVVFITYPADKAILNDEFGQVKIGSSGILFDNGTAFNSKLTELSDVNVSGVIVQGSVFDLNITNKSLSLGDMTGATNTNNVLVGYVFLISL